MQHRAVVAGGDWYLTVQHKPVFRLSCSEAYQYAHRGTIYPYAMTVERLNGFTGRSPFSSAIGRCTTWTASRSSRRDSAGREGVRNLVYLPETMHVSVQHHSRPYAQGYASFTDKWGQSRRCWRCRKSMHGPHPADGGPLTRTAR